MNTANPVLPINPASVPTEQSSIPGLHDRAILLMSGQMMIPIDDLKNDALLSWHPWKPYIKMTPADLGVLILTWEQQYGISIHSSIFEKDETVGQLIGRLEMQVSIEESKHGRAARGPMWDFYLPSDQREAMERRQAELDQKASPQPEQPKAEEPEVVHGAVVREGTDAEAKQVQAFKVIRATDPKYSFEPVA